MLLWTWLVCAGVAVAVPVPWSRVEPVSSDATTTFDGDKHVCLLDDIMYRAGDSVPAPTPCDKCVCQPPGVACTTVKCEKKPGCRALQKSNQCCPEYQCECERDGKIYNNGEKLESPDNPCEVCYCRGGVVVCTLITCYKRDDCQPQEVPGRCCPKYDHCPPLDSSNMKLTTNWPTSNTSLSTSASRDSALNAPDASDNLLTTVLSAVTSSRRLALPDEHRVTRVPGQTSSDTRHESTTPSQENSPETKPEVESLPFTADTGNYETTSPQDAYSRFTESDNAEDSVAESSEHSPIKVFSTFDISVMGNETGVVENRTLDNSVDYAESVVQESEVVSVTELSGVDEVSTTEGDNSTAAIADTSEASLEATTEVLTTENYSVLATPSLLVTSSRASLTSEPWEEHRPTQMVTDDIQYVTTFDPLTSIAEGSSTEVTTLSKDLGVGGEAKSNVSDSQETTSTTPSETSDSSTEKETQSTIESVTESEAVNSNDESSTVFDMLLQVSGDNVNETEASESEPTDSSTQEPTEMLTSMETQEPTEMLTSMATLLDEVAAASDFIEVGNEDASALNTTNSEDGGTTTETPTLLTTLKSDESDQNDDVEQQDSLPVLKLSEEMANHQMDFVIHHIVVPTESEDNQEDAERLVLETEIPEQQSTRSTEEDSSKMTASVIQEESGNQTGSDEKKESSTIESASLIDNDDTQKERIEQSLIGENVTLEIITGLPGQENVTTTNNTNESENSQEKVLSANKSEVADEETVSSNQTVEAGVEATTEQNAEERITDTPSTVERNNLPGLSDDVSKEVEASRVPLQTKDAMIAEDEVAEKMTQESEIESSSTASVTEEIQIITSNQIDEEFTKSTPNSVIDERFASETASPTTIPPDSLARDIISSNLIVDDLLPVTSNDSIDDDEENNTTIPEESRRGENSSEILPTTEETSNATSSNFEPTEFETIQEKEQFQPNRSTEGQEESTNGFTENLTQFSGFISEDNTSEPGFEESDTENTTILYITGEPTDTIHIVTTSVVIAPSENDDELTRPEVKRDTVLLTRFPPEYNSAIIQNSNSQNLFTDLQREDAEEMGKYDLALLQNFFKNLYIHDDHAVVEVT